MAIVNGYCTLAQARAAIGSIGAADTSKDTAIELAVEAASRGADSLLGYRAWQDGTVKTREFWAQSSTICDLYDQPGTYAKAGISTTTGLVVKIDDDGDGTFETTLTESTDFILLPADAADETPVEPYTEIRLVENYNFPRPSNGRPGVQVTAQFGWPAVPDWLEQATIIQAVHLYKSKDTPFGIATFGESGGMRATRWHPTALALLDPHARPSVG